MLKTARKLTGLDDFGSEMGREALGVLAKSIDQEGNLHPFGRRVLFGSLMQLTTNRLRVMDYLKKHPEVACERIQKPIVVTGFPRTGTTLLHNLLSADPNGRPLLAWEAYQPVPSAREKPGSVNPRLRYLARTFRGMRYLAPRLESLHALHADRPEECTSLLRNSFIVGSADLFATVPSYKKWVRDQPREAFQEAYEFYHLQLRVLQHQRAGGHWVLKSPAHFPFLDILLEELDTASVVVTHRDPAKVVPSACSLVSVFRGMASEKLDALALGSQILESFERQQERILDMYERLPRARVLDVRYDDLVSDPLNVVRGIYDHFGQEMPDEMAARIADWLARNPQHKHGPHRYTPEQFGLTAEEIRSTMRPYCERFGLVPADAE